MRNLATRAARGWPLAALAAGLSLAVAGTLHAQAIGYGFSSFHQHGFLGPQTSISGTGLWVGTPGMTSGVITPLPWGVHRPWWNGPGHWYGPGIGYYPAYGYYPSYPLGYYRVPVTAGSPFIPAETMFGPGAVRRFMGVDPPLPTTSYSPYSTFGSTFPVTAPVGVPAAPAVGGGVPAAAPQAPAGGPPGALQRPDVRVSNASARARAWDLIRAGDGYFREGKLSAAQLRYRGAADAAPDLAEAYFRLTWAALAGGKFDEAARQAKFGLRLMPDWPASTFALDRLYGPDQDVTRAQHLDALAAAAEQQPTNADLLFLIGLTLYFDGQADRARAFFTRGGELSDDLQPYVAPFLGRLGAGGPEVAAPPAPAGRAF